MSPLQRRAIANDRMTLKARGLVRFEVIGREADRDLMRSLARRLADDGPEAARLRAAITTMMSGNALRKGGILAALRGSPLVGADLDLARERVDGRAMP